MLLRMLMFDMKSVYTHESIMSRSYAYLKLFLLFVEPLGRLLLHPITFTLVSVRFTFFRAVIYQQVSTARNAHISPPVAA